jgi:hypothetical protein
MIPLYRYRINPKRKRHWRDYAYVFIVAIKRGVSYEGDSFGRLIRVSYSYERVGRRPTTFSKLDSGFNAIV